MLLQIAARVFHRPDIQRAIAIGDEIDAAVLPHRRETLSDVISRQIRGFSVFGRKAPSFACRSAVVAFDGLAMKGGTDEIDRSCGIHRRFTRLAERDSRMV